MTEELRKNQTDEVISSTLVKIDRKIDKHLAEFQAHKLSQEKANEKTTAEYAELRLALAKQNENIQPMIEIFGNLRWGQKVLIKLGILLGGTVSFGIGLVELLKLIINFHK